MTAPTIDIDTGFLRSWPLPQPDDSGDKEQRGTVLVVAGSREMPGAARLAAIAALRTGAGKLIVATAASVAAGIALGLDEARVVAVDETSEGGLDPAAFTRIDSLLECADAVVIGPGMQDAGATRSFVRAVVDRAADAALVIDALAMDVVAEVGRFERPVLLTPHAGEMAHLLGIGKDRVCADRRAHAIAAARRWNAVVALKGARTYIASPDGRCWCHTGHRAGLSTSGSGDVLAGVFAGLAARGAPLELAAVWAVALHARAGAALAARHGAIGYLAGELPGELPRVMAQLSPTHDAKDDG